MGGKLSVTDRKILAQLLCDSRQPISRIAAKARVSKQNASSRIASLLARGSIGSFVSLIDCERIGYSVHIFNFKLKPVSARKERQVIAELLSLGVLSLLKCEGEWDLSLSIASEGTADLAKKSLRLHRALRGIVLSMHWAVHLGTSTAVPRAFSSAQDSPRRPVELGAQCSQERINQKDKGILSAIASNTRISYSDLGKQTGMPPETARYHLKSLEARKIIKGYTINLGSDLEGFRHYRVFLNLSSPTEENVRAVASFLISLPQVRRVTRIVSEYELMYDVRASGEREMREINQSVVRRFHRIMSMQALVRIVKEYRFCYFQLE